MRVADLPFLSYIEIQDVSKRKQICAQLHWGGSTIRKLQYLHCLALTAHVYFFYINIAISFIYR